MTKDFDAWNRRKKQLEKRVYAPHAYPREIWWCSFGLNIGAEIDGKYQNFERPCIIMRVYNLDMVLVLPITSIEKSDRYHFQIKTSQRTAWVKLTQPRSISTKRLLRKIEVIGISKFGQLRAAFMQFM